MPVKRETAVLYTGDPEFQATERGITSRRKGEAWKREVRINIGQRDAGSGFIAKIVWYAHPRLQ